MSDWMPGDLALCVSNDCAPDAVGFDWGVNIGGIYTVAEVGVDDDGWWLTFWEDPFLVNPDDAVWEAHIFRKLEEHTPDAEDAETIRLLNGQPVEARDV